MDDIIIQLNVYTNLKIRRKQESQTLAAVLQDKKRLNKKINTRNKKKQPETQKGRKSCH